MSARDWEFETVRISLMVWTAPPTASRCARVGLLSKRPTEGAAHMVISTLGIDLAKSFFQLHGVAADGEMVLQKRVRRSALLPTLAALPPCLIGLEACPTAYYWAREIGALGHEVRLIPPAYEALRQAAEE